MDFLNLHRNLLGHESSIVSDKDEIERLRLLLKLEAHFSAALNIKSQPGRKRFWMPRTKLKLRRLYSKKLFLKLGLILKTASHDYSESP